MTDALRKKPQHPFARATTQRTLVSAQRTIALPTAALLHALLAACGGRADVDPAIRDDVPTRARTVTTSSATTSTAPATKGAPGEQGDKPMMGGAAEIEQTIVLTPPPPPPAKPKPVLGKPHGIKPPPIPYPLAGDLMMVVPRPVGNGARPV